MSHMRLRQHICRGAHALGRFAVLGACVAGVFAASFGPFVLQGQLRQVRFQVPTMDVECLSTSYLL